MQSEKREGEEKKFMRKREENWEIMEVYQIIEMSERIEKISMKGACQQADQDNEKTDLDTYSYAYAYIDIHGSTHVYRQTHVDT